jgi:hypothetical protein
MEALGQRHLQLARFGASETTGELNAPNGLITP